MNISKLKGLMAEHNETRKDVAKVLNISESAVKNKLLGKSKFYFEEIVALSKHYNVEINIFLVSN